MFENLAEVKRRYEEITGQLSDPEVITDQARYRKLSKEHNDLTPIVAAYDRYCSVEHEMEDQRQILEDPNEDPELKAMAHQETPALRKRLEDLGEELRHLLVPKDPLDNSDIVLEIRAGTGGEEASLFAADLYRMYMRYAERHGWRTELLSASYSDTGGFKEVIMGVEGNEVYRRLKFEGGVHRVQRVPQTETQGRIHTSAATVAVLAEAEEIEVDIHPQDLRIDVFRSSGPGGQSVNTTDSAVRITHLPTGIVVQSQDEKSQHKNKSKALKVLRARLYDRMLEEQHSKEAAQRRSMVGSGDRSERIRTYNFPQGRVTDHRIGLTLYKLEQVMLGDLDDVVDALLEADQTARLQAG
ncbi:MAG TPA: peptide chain release factor 1 [bacterium]|nr:peptide chain release factor 1 [bacterium]